MILIILTLFLLYYYGYQLISFIFFLLGVVTGIVASGIFILNT